MIVKYSIETLEFLRFICFKKKRRNLSIKAQLVKLLNKKKEMSENLTIIKNFCT